MVLFVETESGSVLVFVEVKLLVGFGSCKSLKVGILYRTYEKVSRPGPCNFNGDAQGGMKQLDAIYFRHACRIRYRHRCIAMEIDRNNDLGILGGSSHLVSGL